MTEIITDLSSLAEASEPLKFIDKDGSHMEEGNKIAKEIKDALADNSSILALSAPQLGIKKRVIGLRFADEIKIFINPVITKKDDYKIGVETYASMPGKEILTSRPESITMIYTNGDFKYEDNKFIGYAARLLDQQINALDGVTPADIGLVSDIEKDGAFSDLTSEEKEQAADIYRQFVKAKSAAAKNAIESDAELKKHYKKMKLAEDVVSGRTLIVENPEDKKTTGNRAQRREIAKRIKRAQSKRKQKTNAKKGRK